MNKLIIIAILVKNCGFGARFIPLYTNLFNIGVQTVSFSALTISGSRSSGKRGSL